MERRLIAFLGAIVLAAANAAGASADPLQIGADVMIVHGTHTERDSSAAASADLAPLITLSQRVGRITIAAEGIPPIGEIPVRFNNLGLSSVALNYVSGAAVYRIAPSTQIGLGETIYNQRSKYVQQIAPAGISFSLQNVQIDSSRVAGMQYQILQTLRSTRRSSFTLRLSYNPHMTANLLQTQSWIYHSNGHTSVYGISAVAPEVGSQIDVLAQNAMHLHRLDLVYGVRYIALNMHFPNGLMADRNIFVTPFIGISAPVSR